MPTRLSEPYSRDTTPEAQRFLNKVVREMPELRRSERLFNLSEFAREMSIQGHLSREPGLTRPEAKLRVIRTMLGEQLFQQVYGRS